ncbi:MAG: Crp/Fnr family transcriptional regulator [Janthinobacterium lividum]
MSNNLFLDSLSPESRRTLMNLSTAVSLPMGKVLYEPEAIPDYGYFLTSGIASTITKTRNGDSAEVGLLGHEGLVGSLQLLGPAPVPAESMVQIEGTALRISLRELRKVFQSSEEIRNRLLEFVQNEALTTIQISGCHRLHGTGERMCRWLLMVQDRVETEELKLTHSFLALMLGIRRPTVTLVARSLQKQGLLELNRGSFTIVDRPKMEANACECYETVKQLYTNLYKRHGKPSNSQSKVHSARVQGSHSAGIARSRATTRN